MFEDILEVATGRWGIAAVVLLAMPGGRKFLRTAAKEVIRAGMLVSDRVKDLAGEIREEASDVVAEIQAERKDNQQKKHSHKAEA